MKIPTFKELQDFNRKTFKAKKCQKCIHCRTAIMTETEKQENLKYLTHNCTMKNYKFITGQLTIKQCQQYRPINSKKN